MERHIGFDIIGRCENLPDHRRGKHTTGCYLHTMSANDAKISSWAFSMALPFMTKAINTWFDNLRAYIRENREMLESHVAKT